MFQGPRLASFFLSLLFVTFSNAPVLAQTTCEWSRGFHLDDFERDVLASAIFDHGNGPAMIVGGRFETVNGRTVNHVAKWDGTEWQALGDGLPGAVFALKVYDDGTGDALYAGGYFRSVGGIDAGFIAKWDGRAWSPVGGGMDAGVNALAVWHDGTDEVLVAGGIFGQAGGDAIDRLAKWDGNAWSSLGASFPQGGRINDMSIWLGSLVIGGSFRYLGNQEMNNIAYLSGGSWRSLSGGTSATVTSVEVFGSGSDARIHAAGYFTQAGGVTVDRVAKWNLIGWESLGTGADDTVHALEVLDLGDGPRLYAGGRFTQIAGQATGHVAHWDGSSWQTLESNLVNTPYLLFSHDFGEGPVLFTGGAFAIPHGARNFAAWDGEQWNAWGRPERSGHGLDGAVAASTAFDDDTGPALFVAGDFSIDDGESTARIAKWQGSRWIPLPSGSAPTRVTDMAGFDDGNGPALFVAGQAEIGDSTSIEGVAKWDGSEWTPLGAGIDGSVSDLEVLDDGSGPALYVAGDYMALDGSGATDIAKWDGTTWTALGSGANAGVAEVEVFDDGNGPALYAVGYFGPSDIFTGRVARWDGMAWTALDGGAFDSGVSTLEVYDDGSGPALYAAGSFSLDFSSFASMGKVARWDGESWSGLTPGIGYERVRDLAVFDDTDGPSLYATGFFEIASGETVNHIAKWNGSAWQPLGAGLEARVDSFVDGNTLEVFDDGVSPSLFVGGQMTLVDGRASANIGRYGCFEPPNLRIEAPEVGAMGERITVNVHFDHGGRNLARAAFDLDYDESCLDPDTDGDGELDEAWLPSSEAHSPTLLFDIADTGGELAVIFDDATAPIAPLPSAVLLTLGFEVTCAAEAGDFIDAEIRFGTELAPVFGTDIGESVDGTTIDDRVRIWADWLLFADGFESGTLEAWDEVIIE